MPANKPLVPTRNGEAPLLAAQRRRWVLRMKTYAPWLLLLTASARVASAEGDCGIAVRLTSHSDLGGTSEITTLEVGTDAKAFILREEGFEDTKIIFKPVEDCRLEITIESSRVTSKQPSPWPSSFGPSEKFTVGLYFPRHREEIHGEVVSIGCSHKQSTPNKPIHATCEDARA